MLAVLVEGLLLLMLLSLGLNRPAGDEDAPANVVTFKATNVAEETPEPTRPEPTRPEPRQAEQRPTPQPRDRQTPPPTERTEPRPLQTVAPSAVPSPPPPVETPAPSARPKAVIRPSGGGAYGPPGAARSSPGDSVRVGTAPNGEPLYAAAWYREPTDDELRGYLSTATGPGWGLIACRTAPNYRVEDCVGLDEYPQGSQITRAVLAAAWAFKVRPPRLGGQSLVGSWVRIRIDYGIKRR